MTRPRTAWHRRVMAKLEMGHLQLASRERMSICATSSRAGEVDGVKLWRNWALTVVLSTLTLPGCAPLPKAEYWNGFFRHLHPPQYTFQVPDGWRQATMSDYPLLGFNRRLFQTLDEAGRTAGLQRRAGNAERRYRAHFLQRRVDSGPVANWPRRLEYV